MFSKIFIPSNKKISSHIGNLAVVTMVAFLVYGTIATAQRWKVEFQPSVEIDLSLKALPYYAVYSLFRAIIAYLMSLAFTLAIGYYAAKSKSAEKVIVPLLDIGQSIPVLGFLPGLVLGLIAIFPKSNFGLELSCIIMIFTSQVWNMTFSFYSSLKFTPQNFRELSANIGLSPVKKLWLIELPYSANGLAWNSLMSMAGGWFFLAVCEAFTLGDKQFRLYGIGSYMAVAIDKGDNLAIIFGFLWMVALILFMDFFIWRPILSWTRKFRMDEQAEEISDIPFFSMLLKESTLANFIARIYGIIIRAIKNKKSDKRFYMNKANKNRRENVMLTPGFKKVLGIILNSLLILCFIWLFIKIGNLLYSLPSTYYFTILSGAGLTFIRIILVLLLSTIWAVPFAVYVGLSPKRTKFFQPIIQILASFPAPMLYPFALMIFETFGITLGVGSSLLMLLGVQWYVLFNVLAGATLVSEELRDMFRLVGAGRLQTFRDLYFPSIFPYLITGWLTAAGGAWNASIVAEYVVYNGNVIKTLGIGELISESTSTGNFSLLTGSLVVMVIIVVSLNRLVWRNFYALAERKYSFNR